MTLLQPQALWLLAAVGALAGAYVLLQRRRRHFAARFTNLDLLASVAPRRPGWRRHVPAAAMGLALVGLVVGLARPVREDRVPREAATVMLVLDVSASMEATDVAPNRLQAATAAALDFVHDLPPRLRLGLVAFDRAARVIAPPTTDRAMVEQGLARLATGPGTASGEAVYTALDALAAAGASADAGDGAGTPARTAAIVLLSDGATTVGRPVEEAAAAAAERGVPVTTIAFGTGEGTVTVGGREVAVPADRASLARVAETSGGTFFEAASGEALTSVYEDIGSRVGYTTEQREIGMAFVAAGLALLLAGLGAALVWSGRVL